MNRKYIIFILLISMAFGNVELEENNSKSSEILNSILAEYNTNMSFTVRANHSKMELLMHVKMLYSKEDSITRKVFVEFDQPKEISGMNAWIWDYSDGDSKIWITKPGSGKLIEATGQQNKLPIDLSLIQLDASVLNQSHEISDVIDYAGTEAYVIDFYKIKKKRKIGPMMKILVSCSKNEVLKIERLSKKGKLISETLFQEYFEGFPKVVVINEVKSKIPLTINVSDYKELEFEDTSIFQPKDKEND